VRRSHLIGVAAAVVALALPAGAQAGYTLQEIQVSSPVGQPCNLEPAPDGSLWYIQHGDSKLGRIDLKTGNIQKFSLPRKVTVPFLGGVTPYPSPFALGPCDLTFARDGNLWFNHQAANSVGYIEPTPPYRIREISLPSAGSVPMSLASGADGMIYVTATGADKIVQIDPATERIREFATPAPGSGIIGGTAGRDGAHWFVEMVANKVLRFDYATHEMKEFKIPTPGALPFVIRHYDDGLWFTEFGGNAIGHLDPTSGKFTEIKLPTPASFPVGVTLGRDGDIYTDEGIGDNIARIDRTTKTVVREYPLKTKKAFTDEIKQGPDGAIWASVFFAGKLVRLWDDDFGQDPGFPQDGGSVSGATNVVDDVVGLLPRR
jgi:virginiamycin B lyase